jgi:hypothetical protein
MNKVNLILDLDETLINTFQFNFFDNEISNLDCSDNSTVGIINLPNYLAIVFLRPHLINFLKFCFDNFNVGFWTAGSTTYCKEILKLILTEEQFDASILILAKEESCYINLKNNKIFYCIDSKETVKDLKFIWEDDDLSELCKRENTIIIDDNKKILFQNPDNSVLIPQYLRTNKNDNILCRLGNWLALCVSIDDVRNIDKNFLFESEECDLLNQHK